MFVGQARTDLKSKWYEMETIHSMNTIDMKFLHKVRL